MITCQERLWWPSEGPFPALLAHPCAAGRVTSFPGARIMPPALPVPSIFPRLPIAFARCESNTPRVANVQADLVPDAPSSTLSPGGFASPSTPAVSPCHPEPEQTWLTQALRRLPSLYSNMAFPSTWSTLTYPSKFKAGLYSSRKPSLTSQLGEENNPCAPIVSSESAAQQLLITLKWWIYVFALLSVYWTHGKQRFLLTTRSWANRGTPHFTAFCFMVLHRYYGVLWVFICLKNRKKKKRKGCDNPVLSKSVDPIFPRTSAHFESLSHFGNSQYFKVFHCYICDDDLISWCLILLSQKDYDSLKDQRIASIF